MTHNTSFFGTINTHSRGVITLDGSLPHNLKVLEEVIAEGTSFVVKIDNKGGCQFKGQSAVALLLIELKQIKPPTIH